MVTLTTWVAGSVFSRMTTGGSGARDIRVSAPLPVHGQPLGMSGGGQSSQRYKQQSHGFSSVDGDSAALRLQQRQQARCVAHGFLSVA